MLFFKYIVLYIIYILFIYIYVFILYIFYIVFACQRVLVDYERCASGDGPGNDGASSFVQPGAVAGTAGGTKGGINVW